MRQPGGRGEESECSRGTRHHKDGHHLVGGSANRDSDEMTNEEREALKESKAPIAVPCQSISRLFSSHAFDFDLDDCYTIESIFTILV